MSNPQFYTVVKCLLLLPLVVQGLAILVDELHFHFARGLPRREHLGYPLDTFTILAPILWLVFSLPAQANLTVYIAAAFSCLFVINVEFVHADVCAPAEHVNHAVLLIVPLLVFAALALLWPLYHAPAGAIVWLEQFRGLESALSMASILTLYMISQAVYWNLIWKAPATEFEARQ